MNLCVDVSQSYYLADDLLFSNGPIYFAQVICQDWNRDYHESVSSLTVCSNNRIACIRHKLKIYQNEWQLSMDPTEWKIKNKKTNKLGKVNRICLCMRENMVEMWQYIDMGCEHSQIHFFFGGMSKIDNHFTSFTRKFIQLIQFQFQFQFENLFIWLSLDSVIERQMVVNSMRLIKLKNLSLNRSITVATYPCALSNKIDTHYRFPFASFYFISFIYICLFAWEKDIHYVLISQRRVSHASVFFSSIR